MESLFSDRPGERSGKPPGAGAGSSAAVAAGAVQAAGPGSGRGRCGWCTGRRAPRPPPRQTRARLRFTRYCAARRVGLRCPRLAAAGTAAPLAARQAPESRSRGLARVLQGTGEGSCRGHSPAAAPAKGPPELTCCSFVVTAGRDEPGQKAPEPFPSTSPGLLFLSAQPGIPPHGTAAVLPAALLCTAETKEGSQVTSKE